MATTPKPRFTEQEYLDLERTAHQKSEYYRGQIFAMAGATPRHSQIATNTSVALHSALKGTGCIVYDSDLHLYIPATGLYSYADATVVCGGLQTKPGDPNVAINPRLIAEVLSPSTQNYDRGDKFGHYRSIPSFQEYLLMSQEEVFATHYWLHDREWSLKDYRSLQDVIRLGSVPAAISMADIYYQVQFS
jgi:Uma2 family endonuclease